MKLFFSQFSIVLFVIFSLWSCNSNTATSENLTPNVKGLELMETKCFACHNPKAGKSEQMAPPMIAIKNQYLEKFKSKEEFVSHFIDFTSNPQKDKSLMADAVEQFNLMPNMNFDKEELKNIAEYVYDSKLEEPEWYASRNQTVVPEKGINIYKKKGMELALKTKKVLGKNLMGQINKNGTTDALMFCSEKAFPIVDSMSTVLEAKIKRVTDLPRNPNNKAKKDELKYILSMKAKIENGMKPSPSIKEENGNVIGYYPIMTNQMCLQCHGAPNKEIAKETMTKIKTLYPKDEATGYTSDQLRGIWVVEMTK